MAEIVNLNKARKARAHTEQALRASENRVRHGRTAADRKRDRQAAERSERAAEQAKLEPSDATAPTAG